MPEQWEEVLGREQPGWCAEGENRLYDAKIDGRADESVFPECWIHAEGTYFREKSCTGAVIGYGACWEIAFGARR